MSQEGKNIFLVLNFLCGFGNYYTKRGDFQNHKKYAHKTLHEMRFYFKSSIIFNDYIQIIQKTLFYFQ